MTLISTQHGALVYDLGSGSVEFGFAGDLQPVGRVAPCAIQRGMDSMYFGNAAAEKPGGGVEITRIISDSGTLENSNLLCSFFDWTYSVMDGVESSERPVLVTQPSHLSPQQLVKWKQGIAESLFEFAQHPYLCMEHDSVLACFSKAVYTACVVDLGWSCIRVIPVHEGKPLLQSMRKVGGGCFLCSTLDKYFQNEGISVVDPTLPEMSESQTDFLKMEKLKDIIEKHLSFDQKEMTTPGEKFQSVINGKRYDLYKYIGYLYELLSKDTPQGKGAGIHVRVAEAIRNEHTPADIRRQLWRNIVLSGGLSVLPQLETYLEREIHRPAEDYKTSIMPCPNRLIGGANTVWTGGSILASMDTFPEFCISRQEWKESGPTILQQRF